MMMGNTPHNEFNGWMEEQIWKRRLSYRAVARAGGISSARISQVLAGGEPPGWDFCAAMARALDLPLLHVLSKAGLWTETDPAEITEGEYVDLFKRLTARQQSLLLVQMRAWDLHAQREEMAEDRTI